MKHLFDVSIAEEYGVNAAILLENLGYWIKQNEANETNYYDGNYWTYNSRRAYRELFPYMSERQINTAFQKLIDDGLVVTGNYNKIAYDRTLWYALTQKGKSILHFDIMVDDKIANGTSNNVTPIPNINTDSNPNRKTDNKPYKEIISYLNEKAGTKFRASNKETQKHINARISDGFSLEDFKTVVDKKCGEWIGTEWEKYLRPVTLFGTKFESYLNAPVVKRKIYGATGVEITVPSEDDLPFFK